MRAFTFWVPFLFLQALIAMNFGCADGRGLENEHLNNGDEVIFNFEDSPTLSVKGSSSGWDKTFTNDKIALQLNNYGANHQMTCVSLRPDWANNQTEVTPGISTLSIDSEGQGFNQTELGMVEQLNNQTAIKANIDNTSYDISKMLIQGNLKTVVVKRSGKDPKTYARETLENEVKSVQGIGYKNVICTEQDVPLKLTLAKRLSINISPSNVGNVTLKTPGDPNSIPPADENNPVDNNTSAQKQDVLGNGTSATNSGGTDVGSPAAGGCSLQKAINL